MKYDYVVIGAGISGLMCARTLTDAGATVLVLDRSGRPGGRCASRAFDGTLVDYGPVFVHGADSDFLAAVEQLPGRLNGWPRRVHGHGQPCQPRSLSESATRFGLQGGINTFPQSLARNLPITFRKTVSALEPTSGGISVRDDSGDSYDAGAVVLALAVEQAERLFRTLPDSQTTAGIASLLGMFAGVPCLTAIACYDCDQPEWDVSYPDESEVILLSSNETSKRTDGKVTAVVYQAKPGWSHRSIELAPNEWSRQIVDEAARHYGRWAGHPRSVHTHRWRFARVDQGSELAASPILRLDEGTVAFCGDLFAPGGGIEAAWISGRNVARRLLGDS